MRTLVYTYAYLHTRTHARTHIYNYSCVYLKSGYLYNDILTIYRALCLLFTRLCMCHDYLLVGNVEECDFFLFICTYDNVALLWYFYSHISAVTYNSTTFYRTLKPAAEMQTERAGYCGRFLSFRVFESPVRRGSMGCLQHVLKMKTFPPSVSYNHPFFSPPPRAAQDVPCIYTHWIIDETIPQ